MQLKSLILSYTSVNILNAAIPFLLLPILTAYLQPSDYGLLILIQLLMLLSFPLVLMNTQGLIIIEYSLLSLQEFQSLISTIIWVPLVGFLCLELLFYIFQTSIVFYFHVPIQYLFYIPFFVLVQVIPTIIPIIFQAKKEPFNFAKYKISLTLFNILLSLLFVVVYNYGWEGRLGGIVIAYTILSLAGLLILHKLNLLKFTINIDLLKTSLKFGIPLIPHSLAGVLLIMSDRLFLTNMLGFQSVGIYSVAFQIASALTIIMTSINQAWAPSLYEKLNTNPDWSEKINIIREIYKILTFMIACTIAFILVIPYIYDIFIDTTYHEGKHLSILISIALLLQGFYFMITNFIFYTKKTYLLSYITTFSVLILMLLNYFFIQRYGIYGSAYAMIIGWFLFLILTFITANKVYKMPWRLT